MEKKKTITLTLIGMFIFLFGVIGLTYAYWSRTLTQEDQNLVYSDCLKLDVSWGSGGFTLDNAYPMTNDELVSDFFPSQEPYTFTITNSCNKEVPVSINMESLTAEEPELKDDYVDVILWEKKDTETNVFVQDTDTVLSHQGSRIEIGSEDPKPSYKLTDNKENSNKLIKEAKSAYQLYKFVLASKATKEFNLLLFMDYDTPVSTSENVTNNANWAGKITLNNYVTKPTLIETIQTLPVQKEDSGNSGIYLVDHTEAEITWEGTEDQKTNLQQTEYRYAGPNYKDENTDYVHNYVNIDGQTWRIIGLVNTPEGQRVKLVKDESIGNYSWDTSASSVNDGYGVNEWTQSDLMKLLNPDYNTNKLENSSGEPQDTLVNNSLYWNGGEGQCYNDQNNSTIQCSFDDNNKMPESLKNIIEEITWNTGSIDSDVSTKLNTFYNLERSSSTGKICDESAGNDCDDSVERTTSWQGKVGLIYPSDFGYATSGGTENTRTKCFETGFSRWSNYNECYNNDWLKPASGNMWTISPSSYMEYTFYVFRVRDIGGAYNYHARYADDVRPSVYLSTNVVVLSGDGSYREPYTLGLEA